MGRDVFPLQRQKDRKWGRNVEEKQSSRMFPLKLSDLAPEPVIGIYWCQHPRHVVSEDSILFHYRPGRGMKYIQVCCALGTVLIDKIYPYLFNSCINPVRWVFLSLFQTR